MVMCPIHGNPPVASQVVAPTLLPSSSSSEKHSSHGGTPSGLYEPFGHASVHQPEKEPSKSDWIRYCSPYNR